MNESRIEEILNRADELIAGGDARAAEVEMGRLRELGIDHPPELEQRMIKTWGRLYIALERWTSAAVAANLLLDHDADDADGEEILRLARSGHRQSQRTKADKRRSKKVTGSGDKAATMAMLIDAEPDHFATVRGWIELGNPEEAQRALSSMPREVLAEEIWTTLEMWPRIFFLKGQFSMAEGLCREALASDGDPAAAVWAFDLLAQALRSQRKDDEAKAVVVRGIDKLIQLARKFAPSDPDAALTCLASAVDLDPDAKKDIRADPALRRIWDQFTER